MIFCVVLTIFATMAYGMFDTVWFRPQLQIIFWINIAILNWYILRNKNIQKTKFKGCKIIISNPLSIKTIFFPAK